MFWYLCNIFNNIIIISVWKTKIRWAQKVSYICLITGSGLWNTYKNTNFDGRSVNWFLLRFTLVTPAFIATSHTSSGTEVAFLLLKSRWNIKIPNWIYMYLQQELGSFRDFNKKFYSQQLVSFGKLDFNVKIETTVCNMYFSFSDIKLIIIL